MTAEDWRPIETAPKDGTRFRLWANDMEWHVRWTDEWTGAAMGGWLQDNGIVLYPVASKSYWQPIVGPKTEGGCACQ